jgi:hypothetical protein
MVKASYWPLDAMDPVPRDHHPKPQPQGQGSFAPLGDARCSCLPIRPILNPIEQTPLFRKPAPWAIDDVASSLAGMLESFTPQLRLVSRSRKSFWQGIFFEAANAI